MNLKKINLNSKILNNEISLIISATILIILCSKIYLPLKPVPVTLQTLSISLIGLLYKPRIAFAAVVSYIVLGITGLPIFSGHMSGIAILKGPTIGYLIGFLIAAPVVSYMYITLGKKGFKDAFISSLCGSLIIYLFGFLYLAQFLGSFNKAFELGVLPFLLPGLVKIFLLSYILKFFNKKNEF